MSEQHPDRVEPLVYLSLALRRGEDFEAAEAVIERALAMAPEDGRALWQLGLLRNLQQRPEEALAAFDKLAAQATPQLQRKADGQASFHYQRGIALKALDRMDEATLAMRTATERDPTLLAAAYSHYLLLRSKDREAAELQLQAVEELRTSQPDWIRNDILRLEAGPLSEIDWPEAYEGLLPKGTGELYHLALEGVRSRADGIGSVVEIWTRRGVLRRNYDQAPLAFRVAAKQPIPLIRIVWPHGMKQNVFGLPTGDLEDNTIRIREELFIKGSWGGVKIQD
jgi:tetratricopeptide (TPR) repeat protein